MSALNSIMLVDDNVTTNFLHETLIMEMNIADDLIIASNGREALEKLHDLYLDNRCPDLILLDLNMPVMDGFEFLLEFNDTYIHAPPPVVVIVSSSSHSDDLEKAKELNVRSYIYKPLKQEDLIKIIDQFF